MSGVGGKSPADEAIRQVRDWTPNRETIEVIPGRKMVVRKSVPMTVLVADAMEEHGPGPALALALRKDNQEIPPEMVGFALMVQAVITKGMLIRPAVVPDEDMPAHVELDDDGIPEFVTIRDLMDEEIESIVARAMEGVDHVTRFRGDGDGVGDGGDSSGVAVKSKPRARAARGKS